MLFLKFPWFLYSWHFGSIMGVSLPVSSALGSPDGPASHLPHQPHLLSLHWCHLPILSSLSLFQICKYKYVTLCPIYMPFPLISLTSVPLNPNGSAYLYLQPWPPPELQTQDIQLSIWRLCLNIKKAFQS